KFAFDLRGGEALRASLDEEAADHVVELGPDDCAVGRGTIPNPGLRPVALVAGRYFLGARDHRPGIGTVIGLRQPEASDHLAGWQLWQKCAALRVAAVH